MLVIFLIRIESYWEENIVKNYLSRGKNLLVIILLMNMVFIFNSEKIKNIFLIIATVLLGILYLYINIIPRKDELR